MHPIYEYIVATLILFLILSYSFYAIDSAVATQLTLAKEEQLKPVANRLFNKIFFTSGYPDDWGSDVYINESNLIDFGLLSDSKRLYELDVNKVMRLVNTTNNTEGTVNPLYISPKTFGQLSGIYEDGHWIYGFRLMITSALNISIQPINTDNPPTKFNITVTDYTGKKASNAEVRGVFYGTYTYEIGNQEVFNYSCSSADNITGLDGSTVLNFTLPYIPPNSREKAAYSLIVTANYYGLQSQNIWVEEGILNLVVEGRYLIVNMTDVEGVIPSARHLSMTAIEFTSDLKIILNPLINATGGEVTRIINKGRYNYQVYELSNPISEDTVFVALLVKTRGGYYLVFASRPRTPLTVDYMSHSFLIAGLKTETVYGLFRIGRNTFYAQLIVWRMSE